MFSAIKAIGAILLGFGIVQIGLALKGHDAAQRAQGFMTFFGGVVIYFAKLCLLAFNLWNGYIEPGCEQEAAPYDLFACGYAPYLLEGIRLRYPEYCREQTKTKELPPER